MILVKALRAGLVSASLALTALGFTASAETQDVRVVASFSILGDMVEEVVGDLASVNTIVGPDADAHVYRPSVADALAVAEADVIFVNGLGFETWAATLISESGTRAVVHVATDGITPIKVDGATDPHAWNSLRNGKIYVRNIASAMGKAMPEHAGTIGANANAYIAELEALDAKARARLSALPAKRRTVVTAHDAFGYLADNYGLTFLAPLGIDTQSDPSARDLAVLIAQLQAEAAAALFVENIASPALVRQISDETGIAIGGRLFSDALSKRGGPATSYLEMFRHNLGALLDALEHPTVR
ncbi:MAG: zinc ABC transporter substrate-binding protein [Gammaproteobacteria bacterium]|nr:zinc ABC transporter substrate-binding protein [Gammaproteobacteria bacterium]MDE0507863.1 zinc ABC transporter substrate-binding protein [Gammaproteobacteria bacterium]MYC58665.1 metal ABC transporter substrate-binding protein [Gammaproteobacteria bacterium]MYE19859.1 metal ABC transporter substrate-binding protein [Rhodospirillales bacterium]